MCQGLLTGLGCCAFGVVLGQIPTFWVYFCLPLHIFHQKSFISKVNPEEVVHQEFCDFFLLCLQPELLNGSAPAF